MASAASSRSDASSKHRAFIRRRGGASRHCCARREASAASMLPVRTRLNQEIFQLVATWNRIAALAVTAALPISSQPSAFMPR